MVAPITLPVTSMSPAPVCTRAALLLFTTSLPVLVRVILPLAASTCTSPTFASLSPPSWSLVSKVPLTVISPLVMVFTVVPVWEVAVPYSVMSPLVSAIFVVVAAVMATAPVLGVFVPSAMSPLLVEISTPAFAEVTLPLTVMSPTVSAFCGLSASLSEAAILARPLLAVRLPVRLNAPLVDSSVAAVAAVMLPSTVMSPS